MDGLSNFRRVYMAGDGSGKNVILIRVPLRLTGE